MLRGELDLEAVRLQIKEGAAEALNAAAESVCAEARALCPVETGRLKGSLRVRAEGERFYVSTDCEYAAAVEFGTSRRHAQPFLSEAAQRERGRRV